MSAATRIFAERLVLVLMTPAFLEACLNNNRGSAAQLIGAVVPPDWLEERWLMELRLKQAREDLFYAPWMPRAIVRRNDNAMIGHIGFHSQPDPAYLREIAPGGVELGYTVFPAHRQQGYAREACAALIDWAHYVQHVKRFILSISPSNAPSQRLAKSLGFQKIGTQEDDDGPEDVFELRKNGELPAPSSGVQP